MFIKHFLVFLCYLVIASYENNQKGSFNPLAATASLSRSISPSISLVRERFHFRGSSQ